MGLIIVVGSVIAAAALGRSLYIYYRHNQPIVRQPLRQWTQRDWLVVIYGGLLALTLGPFFETLDFVGIRIPAYLERYLHIHRIIADLVIHTFLFPFMWFGIWTVYRYVDPRPLHPVELPSFLLASIVFSIIANTAFAVFSLPPKR